MIVRCLLNMLKNVDIYYLNLSNGDVLDVSRVLCQGSKLGNRDDKDIHYLASMFNVLSLKTFIDHEIMNKNIKHYKTFIKLLIVVHMSNLEIFDIICTSPVLPV